jgi:hypothetical protein
MLARVVQAPEFGALLLRIPVVLRVAEREYALLRARFFLVAPRAAEGEVEAELVERELESLRLPHIRVQRRAVLDRIDAEPLGLGIAEHDQFETRFARDAVAQLVHRAEFPRGVHAATGTAAAPGRTPCARDAAAPSCPCRSNKA